MKKKKSKEREGDLDGDTGKGREARPSRGFPAALAKDNGVESVEEWKEVVRRVSTTSENKSKGGRFWALDTEGYEDDSEDERRKLEKKEIERGDLKCLIEEMKESIRLELRKELRSWQETWVEEMKRVITEKGNEFGRDVPHGSEGESERYMKGRKELVDDIVARLEDTLRKVAEKNKGNGRNETEGGTKDGVLEGTEKESRERETTIEKAVQLALMKAEEKKRGENGERGELEVNTGVAEIVREEVHKANASLMKEINSRICEEKQRIEEDLRAKREQLDEFLEGFRQLQEDIHGLISNREKGNSSNTECLNEEGDSEKQGVCHNDKGKGIMGLEGNRIKVGRVEGAGNEQGRRDQTKNEKRTDGGGSPRVIPIRNAKKWDKDTATFVDVLKSERGEAKRFDTQPRQGQKRLYQIKVDVIGGVIGEVQSVIQWLKHRIKCETLEGEQVGSQTVIISVHNVWALVRLLRLRLIRKGSLLWRFGVYDSKEDLNTDARWILVERRLASVEELRQWKQTRSDDYLRGKFGVHTAFQQRLLEGKIGKTRCTTRRCGGNAAFLCGV